MGKWGSLPLTVEARFSDGVNVRQDRLSAYLYVDPLMVLSRLRQEDELHNFAKIPKKRASCKGSIGVW